MKLKALFLFTASLFLLGCDDDENTSYSQDTYPNEYEIYQSSENETVFREFLLILKPYTLVENEKKFLVTDSLSNVFIKINNKDWGKFTSLDVDTSLFEPEIENGLSICDGEVKYSVIAPYQTSKDTLTTAGEYSKLLNNKFTIEPGFYIFEIESFEFKTPEGTLTKVKTPIVEAVEVKENSRNIFVGEFEIEINQ